MKPKTRLAWCALVVFASFIYAGLVAADADVAGAVMLGYVALLLTVFVANEVWKKS